MKIYNLKTGYACIWLITCIVMEIYHKILKSSPTPYHWNMCRRVAHNFQYFENNFARLRFTESTCVKWDISSYYQYIKVYNTLIFVIQYIHDWQAKFEPFEFFTLMACLAPRLKILKEKLSEKEMLENMRTKVEIEETMSRVTFMIF